MITQDTAGFPLEWVIISTYITLTIFQPVGPSLTVREAEERIGSHVHLVNTQVRELGLTISA